MHLAAVQMKFADSLAGNLGKIGRAAAEASAAGADSVLYPECATTGYACDFSQIRPGPLREVLHEVAAIAGRLGVNLLVGSPVFAGQRLYNGMLVFDRAGRLAHTYAKCQLTARDRECFTPGDSLSLFSLDDVPATAIICHERRYPELVRLPAMAGARLVFHPNAGLDELAVSKTKRKGRDGMAVRAFENAIGYVFANSVGPQGGGLWSAGDSKIVAPDGAVLALAGNCEEQTIVADLVLEHATGRYAEDSLRHPRFLAAHWRKIVPEMRRRSRETDRRFLRWYEGRGR